MHVFNGTAAAGSFMQAFESTPNDDFLVCNDVISCGPLSPFESIETWMSLRERFWGGVLEQNQSSEGTFASKPRDLYANLDELATAAEVTVWLGGSLSDQLLLAFVAYLLDRDILASAQLQVVQFERLQADSNRVRGLGELYPEAVFDHPDPVVLGRGMTDYCLRVWQAVTADTPAELLALLDAETAPLPQLQLALAMLRLRYPSEANGLSAWDERLLAGAHHGGRLRRKAARIVGDAITAGLGDADPLFLDGVGDYYIYGRLLDLCSESLAEPLLAVHAEGWPMDHTEVGITTAGIAVLDGRANAVGLNGIDDWVCGVHLDSANGSTWFRDGDRLVRRE